MTVSVVVLTLNSEKHIGPCPCCTSGTRPSLPDEVIVVDNGSQDRTRDILSKSTLPCPLVVVENEENRGVAPARNQGIGMAQGDLILLLDDDARLEADTLSLLISYLNDATHVGLVAPQLRLPSGVVQRSCRRFPHPFALLYRGSPLGSWFPRSGHYAKYMMHDYDHRHARRVDWVVGACQLIRREALDDVGLLDEGYFFGYEDVDLCHRLGAGGWEVHIMPQARAIHHYRRSSRKGILSRRKLQHIQSIVRFYWQTRGD